MTSRTERGLQANATMADPRARRAVRRWTVGDVIDFENRAGRDADVADMAGFTAAPAHDRRTVFLSWVDFVRARSADASPGTVFDHGRRLVQALAVLAGLLLGGGLAGALLSRAGAEPINAPLFFGGAVGLQLGVLVVAVVAWPLRKARLRFGVLHDATLLLVGLVGRALSRLDGERRTALQARWAGLDFRSGVLAPLVGCQLLVVTQAFAVAFNVGLLAALLLVYLPFEELRFGWQSTYSVGANGVDRWVRVVSAPWTWMSGTLAPTPEQVASTRYTRGQRAETLPAAAAHAWWPFLVCAIAFYGLLLRALLAVAASVVLRYRLAHLRFASPAADALWRRLWGPLVTSPGGGPALPHADEASHPHRSGRVDLLIVDDEVVDAADRVRADAGRLFGGMVARTVVATTDDDLLREELVAALRCAASSIVVALPASRDPIVAIAGFLRALTVAAPVGVDTTLLLVGDTQPGGVAAVADERMTIWRRFVLIQRLKMSVERCG